MEDEPVNSPEFNSPSLGILAYLLLAFFATGIIVMAIRDFDRHFPNPRFHLSPALAYTWIGLASAALVLCAYRLPKLVKATARQVLDLIRRIWP